MTTIAPFDPFYDFYHSPLSAEDWLAGGTLIVLCLIFIPLTALVGWTMYRADKEIIGYRYLVSSTIADIMNMLLYGGCTGVAILLKDGLTHNKDTRSAMHFIIDWMWFAFCFHYPLIAWSRFAAIRMPMWFRSQKRWHSYLICVIIYLFTLVVVLCTHWAPFFVRFYFEPAAYGLLAEDFVKYLTAGHSAMFMGMHIFCVVVPMLLYLWTIALLVRDRNVAGAQSKGRMSVEKLLMVPCILANVIFVLGQVAITIGTGTGKWATWMICFLFVVNSAANCVMLLLFSPSLRASIFRRGSSTRKVTQTSVSQTRSRQSIPSSPNSPL